MNNGISSGISLVNFPRIHATIVLVENSPGINARICQAISAAIHPGIAPDIPLELFQVILL